jgi:hypothetical protein
MNESNHQAQANAVLGQKYAFATASLMMGVACFVNLLGMEKAILAVLFAWMALKSEPAPVLKERRLWGKVGLSLGLLQVVMISTILILFRNEVGEFIDALIKLGN